MASIRGVARLGMLAVGLGIGAAVASSPGIASADPFSFDPNDIAISFDGYVLVSDGSAHAYTTTGDYGLAIADGSGAYASAEGGTGDYALADGTYTHAEAGGLASDTGADDDTAIDIGNNVDPSTYLAPDDGAYAGDGDLAGGTGTGSGDTAIDIGDNTNDASLGGGGADGSFAGAGGTHDGNNDTAIDIGDNSGLSDGSSAVGGNGNFASESGSTTGEYEGAEAIYGNDNTAVADTSYTTNGVADLAGFGSDNYASVLGPENSFASAENGDSNVAFVVDPFGSTDSYAETYGSNSDLAAVLFTEGHAFVFNAPDVYDIVTAFGPESGMF